MDDRIDLVSMRLEIKDLSAVERIPSLYEEYKNSAEDMTHRDALRKNIVDTFYNNLDYIYSGGFIYYREDFIEIADDVIPYLNHCKMKIFNLSNIKLEKLFPKEEDRILELLFETIQYLKEKFHFDFELILMILDDITLAYEGWEQTVTDRISDILGIEFTKDY